MTMSQEQFIINVAQESEQLARRARWKFPYISREDWDKLPDKAKWDVKVALRGPDCAGDPERIKYFTTGVIRAKVSQVMRTGGSNNHHLHCVIIPMGLACPSRVKPWKAWNPQHFFQHADEAAVWLGIPILYISADLWEESIVLSAERRGPVSSIKFILQEMKNEEQSHGDHHPAAIKELERYVSDNR